MTSSQARQSMDSLKQSDSKSAGEVSHAVAVDPQSKEVVPLTGHKRELNVSMSFWMLLALCYGNMSVWTAIGGTLTAGLSSGGSVVMVFGWIFVSLISLAVASCLAEMCSAWPHAAGQAFWVYRLSPSKWAPLFSYWTAFYNILGTWSLVASVCYIISTYILGVAILYHPDYVQQQGHVVGLGVALGMSALLLNIFAIRFFDMAGKVSVAISIIGSMSILVALAAVTPVKQPASFVFTSFSNSTGWSSPGLVALLGLLQSSFSFIGYDSVSHVCEEASNPDISGPRAIFWGVALSGVIGLCYLINMLFCIADIPSVLGSRTLVPLLQLYSDSLGAHGATFCLFLNIFCLYLALVGIMCASSRTVWAMSRDKGFPAHYLFSKISPRYQVPVNALLVSTFIPFAILLCSLGSIVVFFNFFQLATLSYLLSYLAPITLALVSGRQRLPQAAWRMPDSIAKFCQIVSLGYISLVSVLFCIPNYYPVTQQTMNYTAPLLVGFTVLGAVGWYGFCRRSFKGPAADMHLDILPLE